MGIMMYELQIINHADQGLQSAWKYILYRYSTDQKKKQTCKQMRKIIW